MLIREMLDSPASKAIHAPMIKHRREPSVCGMKAKTMATPVVPIVCPMSRAMPSIPLAPPLRLRGADDTNVRLLGVWNKPNPAPQNMILHQISILSALSGKKYNKINPVENRHMPIAPSVPGWKCSTSLPASGATIIVAIGHGVMSSPISTGEKCNVSCRKNGMDTNASICAMKEQTEVATDSVNMRIFSKSTGSNGVEMRNCRRRYHQQQTMNNRKETVMSVLLSWWANPSRAYMNKPNVRAFPMALR